MIEITETAAKQINALLGKRGLGEAGLRVAVKAGGCSGFEYVFAWEKQPRPDDKIFEGAGGAKVFCDKRSLRILNDTTLDFDTSLLSRGFIFQNPNAKSTCGCGVSFSV